MTQILKHELTLFIELLKNQQKCSTKEWEEAVVMHTKAKVPASSLTAELGVLEEACDARLNKM